jgi:hypothetical protein
LIEEDRTNLVQRCWEQRKNKPAYSKIFKLKRIKELSSTNFQEQRGANKGVPKLLRNKEEQTNRSKGEQAMTFQAFQE